MYDNVAFRDAIRMRYPTSPTENDSLPSADLTIQRFGVSEEEARTYMVR